MPDPTEPPLPPDDIAPLLRLGLDEDLETQLADPDLTLRVRPSTPRTGGSSAPRQWGPPSVERLQTVLPQYEITALIARGGMGAVYKGTQRTLKRAVAIKVLPPEMEDGDLQFVERFKHEAQAMAQLSHPNIVAVFDAGDVKFEPTAQEGQGGTLLYFVMEFIEGTDVAQLIASEGRLQPQRAIQITTAVCEALAFAHEEGIIHRDIKPSNIMLDKRGRVKVADFGMAKTVNIESTLKTRSDVAMGTPDFIAPETMILGMKVDGRADLYAVGVMLYQMLTGKIPRGRFALPSGVVPQMDKGFDAIVDKAMQTDRENRYSTATEMRRDVERVCSSGFSPSPVGSSGFSPSAFVLTDGLKPELRTRSRKPLLLGAAAATILLGTAAWLLMDEPAEAEGGVAGLTEAEAMKAVGVAPTLTGTLPRWIASDFTAPSSDSRVASGHLHISAYGAWVDNMLRQPRDLAMRASLIWKADTSALKLSTRYVGASTIGHRQTTQAWFARFSDDTIAIGLTDDKDTTIRNFPIVPPIKPGDRVDVQFASIGQQHVVWLNGRQMGELTDARLLQNGQARISAWEAVLDSYAVLPLDGLPEAEALKLAGADVAGKPTTPPPHSKFTPTYPLGQWVKPWKSPQDIPSIGEVTDGWATLAASTAVANPPEAQGRNWGIRLRLRGSESSAFTFPHLLLGYLDHAGYKARVTDGALVISRVDGDKMPEVVLKRSQVKMPASGQDCLLEFMAIGQTLLATLDGQTVSLQLPANEQPQRQGEVLIYGLNQQPFRDVEVINLDGLSEAEALKAAGIGAVPKYAPTYPLGQWVRPFRQAADINDNWIKAGATWENDWITPGAGTNQSITLAAPNGSGKNWGVRARYRWAEHGTATLVLRRGGTAKANSVAAYEWRVDAAKGAGFRRTQANGAGAAVNFNPLGEPAPVKLTAGDEVLVEAFAIEGTLHGRVNGQAFQATSDGVLEQGSFEAASMQMSYRDIEFINLDGLSEAEARKVVGIGP